MPRGGRKKKGRMIRPDMVDALERKVTIMLEESKSQNAVPQP